MNGKVLDRIPLLTDLSKEYNCICIQEHFLTDDSVNLLKFSSDMHYLVQPARRSGTRGRPSGGLAIITRSNSGPPVCVEQNEWFQAAKMHGVFFVNVYLPTNYNDIASEKKFAKACQKLGKCLLSLVQKSCPVIILGDFNCNLDDHSCPRAVLLLNALPSGFKVAKKDKCYSYISTAKTVSNLDHVVTYKLDLESVSVGSDGAYSDHLPLSFAIPAVSPQCAPKTKPEPARDWKKVVREQFQLNCEQILKKIKVPFHLLQWDCDLTESEIRLQLNMYFYEICHSLRVAERVAVPLRSVRRGSRVKGWASNSELVKARAAAKFWLGVWHECDRPRSGVVNELRVYTKRRFAKELRKHRSSLKRETVSKIIENPNLVWKLRARPVESTGQNASDIDEEIWVDYFAAEFSPPDEVKNKKFSEELDQLMTKEHNYLVISSAKITHLCQKLKKKLSAGADQICALHLLNGGPVLSEHLAIAYQIILTHGIVPDIFCLGVITPVLKKGKPAHEPSSYRPITVSSVFCKLFEKLIISDIKASCKVPPHQFGFQAGLGCAHALHVAANVLLDAHISKESLAIGEYDVRRAFDSGIHSQNMVELRKSGVDRAIVKPLNDMYSRLKVRIKLSGKLSRRFAVVKKGIKQGAVSSPDLFNNSISTAQSKVAPCCIFKGIDVSLVGFADDLLNFSRILSSLESNFKILEMEYDEIGLSFNVTKCEVLLFNWNASQPEIQLGSQVVMPSKSIVYLGLPIGETLQHTRALLVKHIEKKIRSAYGASVSSKRNLNRSLRAQIFVAVALPHVLYVSPFWKLLTNSNKVTIRRIFFRYLKFLLEMPLRTSNSYLTRRYSVPDPFTAVEACLEKYRDRVEASNHQWTAILT